MASRVIFGRVAHTLRLGQGMRSVGLPITCPLSFQLSKPHAW